MKTPTTLNRRAVLAPTALDPRTFRQVLERDLVQWQPVVKASGFSLDE